MADRRDIDDIKLSTDNIIDVDMDDVDLKDLENDLSALGHDDILDDDFEDPAPRPKRKNPVSILTLVLLIVLVVVGGAFALISNNTVIRAFSSGGDETPADQTAETAAQPSVYPPAA